MKLTNASDIEAALRASRRRRLLGALGGGMVGSGVAAIAVSGLNALLGKPMLLVWVALAIGLPLTVAGLAFLQRIDG